MLLTESGSNSWSNCCFFEQRCPVFPANRPGRRQFGPLRPLCRHDARTLAVRQPFQVVAGGHHRHRKVCARLTNREDQFAPHLLYGRKRVFDPSTGLRDAMVAPLLRVRQRLVPMAFALNPISVTIRLQPGFPFLGWIASVGIDLPAGVGRVDDRLEMLAVVRAGSVGDDLANELVPFVDVHRELVSMVALAMLLGPGRIQVFLTALGGRPIRRHGIFLELFLVVLGEVLPGRGYQRGVDDLTASSDEALLEQLRSDAIKDGLGAGFANPVLENPHRGSVRNVGDLAQTTEALVAHPVQQLVFHLFVGQVVQAFEDQNAHHGFDGKRRPASLWTDRARCNAVNFRRQGDKIDTGLDLGERVPQLVERLLMMLLGKQVCLDRAALLHGG